MCVCGQTVMQVSAQEFAMSLELPQSRDFLNTQFFWSASS